MSPFSRQLLRRACVLLPALPLILLCLSCNGFFVSESSIQSDTISPSAVFLKSGVTPADSYSGMNSSTETVGGTTATNTTTATWTSAQTSIVTVSSAGVLTVGTATSGNTTVTATASGVTSNPCTVILYTGAAPTTITVGSQTGGVTFASGTTFQAIASATFPGDPTLSTSGAITPYVTWSISDTTGTVATINSSTGIVTVINAATPFTVTATATFGAADTSTNPLTATSLQFNGTLI
jgi:hypothetical protein